jgi:hypothetical protein
MSPERSVTGAGAAGRCLVDRDEVARAYVTDSLPKGDVAAFEEHIALCAGCRMAVEDAGKYGKAQREAKRRLRPEKRD